MPRLIDADALQNILLPIAMALEKEYGSLGGAICGVMQNIDNAPTIDPESLRPHGRWGIIILNKENKTICIECAECGADFTIPLFDFGLCYHYCPSCGAKMDEEGEPE